MRIEKSYEMLSLQDAKGHGNWEPSGEDDGADQLSVAERQGEPL